MLLLIRLLGIHDWIHGNETSEYIVDFLYDVIIRGFGKFVPKKLVKKTFIPHSKIGNSVC